MDQGARSMRATRRNNAGRVDTRRMMMIMVMTLDSWRPWRSLKGRQGLDVGKMSECDVRKMFRHIYCRGFYWCCAAFGGPGLGQSKKEPELKDDRHGVSPSKCLLRHTQPPHSPHTPHPTKAQGQPPHSPHTPHPTKAQGQTWCTSRSPPT